MTLAASGQKRPTLAVMSQNQKKDGAQASARLPPKGQGRIFGGRGQGGPCALCGTPIEPSQIEYEIEWQDHETLRRSHLHLACFERLRSDPTE
jgi:hypothetical protein